VVAASFPHVIVAGSPFERGRQHGQQAGELIARHLRLLIEALGPAQPAAAGPALRRDELLARAQRFLPAYEAFAPDLVEEIRGVAAGAHISFAEALLLNVRGEVRGLAEEGCTAFAVGRSLAADDGVLAGQNSDQAAWNEEVMIVLTVRPDDGPAALMCTHAGLIGYHGCNAAGVGQFANAVPATGQRAGMPHYLLKRRLLAQTNVADCLAVLRAATVASPANYVLADRGGDLRDVELTTVGLETLDAEDDLIVHTNHYAHPRWQSYNTAIARLPGSACRAARLAELVQAQSGRVTVETMKQALADQASEPEQICSRAGPYGKTVASLVAELDQGRLHVARGGAATSAYVAYTVS
jgi:isopenicillin-N N-acyltransferase like protein